MAKKKKGTAATDGWPGALRTLRERSNLSLEVVAKRCGMSGGYISKVERGMGDCQMSSIGRILAACGLSLLDLAAEMARADLMLRELAPGEALEMLVTLWTLDEDGLELVVRRKQG